MTRPSHPYPSGPDPYGQRGVSGPAQWDEAQWRRPEGGAISPPTPEAPAQEPPYGGPPKAPVVPGNWRPPTLIQAPAARRMPTQDDTAMDAAERQARTVTHGMAMVAGAALLLVIAVLCGRLIF